MKFKVNYTVNDEPDSVVIEGDSIEECQKKARKEIKKRGAINPWSEEIK